MKKAKLKKLRALAQKMKPAVEKTQRWIPRMMALKMGLISTLETAPFIKVPGPDISVNHYRRLKRIVNRNNGEELKNYITKHKIT